MVLASILQGERGFYMSLKPGLNLCSRRQLKPILNLVNNLTATESLILNVFLRVGLIKLNNVLRNSLYKVELRMSVSNLFHS